MPFRAFGTVLQLFGRDELLMTSTRARSASKLLLNPSVINNGTICSVRNPVTPTPQRHGSRALHLNVGGDHTFVLTHYERGPTLRDHLLWLIQLRDGRPMETYIDIARSLEAHVNKKVRSTSTYSRSLPVYPTNSQRIQAAISNVSKEGWPTPYIPVSVNYHALPNQPSDKRRCEYHCELSFIYPAEGDPPLDGFKTLNVVESVHFQRPSCRDESLRPCRDNAQPGHDYEQISSH